MTPTDPSRRARPRSSARRDPTAVIVGAGLAGAKAAEGLREAGHAGRVVLVGDEPGLPYERPPLSKEYLRGEVGADALAVHAEDFYAERDIEVLPGRSARRLDLDSREVALDDGRRLEFDRLLLGTGAEPRRLSAPGADLDGVRLLRTRADADALRDELARARAVVVVGAGWIGCEVAASARALVAEVTLLDPGAVPLQGALGREMGAVWGELHADHGVRLLMGRRVAVLDGHHRVERVIADDGGALECDLVVAGIGVTPRTGLAEAAGVPVDDGILVDARLETRVPGVFAAGDVARAEHPLAGDRIRVEHWANALHQGLHAGRSMAGATEPYDRVPYFFSDQYDVGMEYTGWARPGDRLVVRGDRAAREFVAFWLRDDRVVAGMNVNVWDATEAIRRLVRARAVADAERLADPGVPLDELAGAAA